MSVPAVTLVIVNYNTGSQTARCLDSAAADLAGTTWEAIVVDNASRPGAAPRLNGRPHVRTILNPRNVGFGTAVNQAARASGAPLLWLVNPDCVVTPGTFEAVRAALEADPGTAIAAPQLLNADGSVQASARGDPSVMTGLFGRHTLLTRFFPRSAVARRNLPARDIVASGDESAEVDWVMGAAMLVRRTAFDAVGGFDERYFMYWEDADLCRRLRDRGWRIRYVPGAAVGHEGGTAAETDRAMATRAFHRSAYLYYITHVQPRPWHPARMFARIALALRAEWRVRAVSRRWPGSSRQSRTTL
jgi:GT2 family glycosyltransferase